MKTLDTLCINECNSSYIIELSQGEMLSLTKAILRCIFNHQSFFQCERLKLPTFLKKLQILLFSLIFWSVLAYKSQLSWTKKIWKVAVRQNLLPRKKQKWFFNSHFRLSKVVQVWAYMSMFSFSNADSCWAATIGPHRQQRGTLQDTQQTKSCLCCCSGRGLRPSDVVSCSTCDLHQVPVLSVWCRLRVLKSVWAMTDRLLLHRWVWKRELVKQPCGCSGF